MKNTRYPINNLNDILTSSYKVVIISSGSTYEFFKTSQIEKHRQIWRRVQKHGTVAQNINQGIQWVKEREEMVLISDGPKLRHVANKQPCDLTTGNYTIQALNSAKTAWVMLGFHSKCINVRFQLSHQNLSFTRVSISHCRRDGFGFLLYISLAFTPRSWLRHLADTGD